jgi:branched-chain amino acid transport system ATP-binding protein
MLSVEDLDAYYGRAHVLQAVSFAVADGEVLALLGRNGAGKSTTMKSLMGLLPPRGGRVVFDGQDIAGWEPHRIARRGVGYVPEDRRIFSDLTVLENLDIGRQRARPGVPPWTAESLFALFPNLGGMRERVGGRMSGGEQQMLAIARTLMGNPRLLLLDEPSEGLSPLIVEQMAEAVLALKQTGVAVLLAEQNLHFAARVADRAVVIESGCVVWSGTMRSLMSNAQVRVAHLQV